MVNISSIIIKINFNLRRIKNGRKNNETSYYRRCCYRSRNSYNKGDYSAGKGKVTAKKNSKTKKNENRSKKALSKMGAGCL